MGILKNVADLFKKAFVDQNPLFEEYNKKAKADRERKEKEARRKLEEQRHEEKMEDNRKMLEILRDIERKL
ncbi:MAG: hypothetical protein E7375_03895 [Clostridiales bacterium]|nr:hypothetical protein [Clostridiales bacterium]